MASARWASPMGGMILPSCFDLLLRLIELSTQVVEFGAQGSDFRRLPGFTGFRGTTAIKRREQAEGAFHHGHVLPADLVDVPER